jgi:hypothetical protein
VDISFNAKNVFNSIVGAVSQPEKRSDLLVRVSSGLMSDSNLNPDELQKGVQDAVDSGLLSVEECTKLFPGVLKESTD